MIGSKWLINMYVLNERFVEKSFVVFQKILNNINEFENDLKNECWILQLRNRVIEVFKPEILET